MKFPAFVSFFLGSKPDGTFKTTEQDELLESAILQLQSQIELSEQAQDFEDECSFDNAVGVILTRAQAKAALEKLLS